MYFNGMGSSGWGSGIEVPRPHTSEVRGVSHKLQVASEVVALSLLGLGVIDCVCIRKFYTVPLRKSHAPFVSVYMQASAGQCVFGFV